MDVAAPNRKKPSPRPAVAPKLRMSCIDKDALRLLLDQAPDAILIYDPVGRRIVDGNRNAEKLFECSHAELLRSSPGRFFGEDGSDSPIVKAKRNARERRALAGEELRFEGLIVGAAGRPAECDVSLCRLPGRSPNLLRASFVDISERKHAERALQRANRALRTLSAGNEALAKATNEVELLDAMCRAIVEKGGYRMAWIGMAEQNEEKSVRPVARAGADNGYLDSADISWADGPRGQGPTGKAIRCGDVQVNQDFLTGADIAPWRKAALARGFAASVAFPLRDKAGIIGALTIYAGEPDAYESDELNFLAELAHHLEFGIESLRAQRANQQAEERIHWLAFHDPETGELNRMGFQNRLSELIEHASGLGLPLTLIAFELRHTDIAVSTFGRENMSALVQEAVRRTRSLLRAQDVLARTGDEAFTVALHGARADQAAHLIGEVRQMLATPVEIKEADLRAFIDVRAGVASFPGHAEKSDLLLRNAEAALQVAGRSVQNFRIYDESLIEELKHRLALTSELHEAIGTDQICVYYQPKVRLSDDTPVGAEALVRWQHPTRGLVSPGEFVPLAEENGLIADLTRTMLRNVLRQTYGWSQSGIDHRISVNLSARGGFDSTLPARLSTALTSWRVSSAQIVLELTESTLMEDIDAGIAILRELKEIGFDIALDDFGTGYSSLLYLQRFPIDEIKLDRSFVESARNDPASLRIARSIVELGHDLGRRIVAEGIEDEPTLDMVRTLGCDFAQGYYFARPMPADAFAQWANDRKKPLLLTGRR